MPRNESSVADAHATFVDQLLEHRSAPRWDDLHVTACFHGVGVGFSYNAGGYARVNLDGKKVVAHALVLEMTSGQPRLVGTDASHLCGNAWCFNPAHLTWEDRTTNLSRRSCSGTILVVIDDKPRWVQVCQHEPLCKKYTRGTLCADPSPAQ